MGYTFDPQQITLSQTIHSEMRNTGHCLTIEMSRTNTHKHRHSHTNILAPVTKYFANPLLSNARRIGTLIFALSDRIYNFASPAVDLGNFVSLFTFLCVACQVFIRRGKQHCWNAEAVIGVLMVVF